MCVVACLHDVPFSLFNPHCIQSVPFQSGAARAAQPRMFAHRQPSRTPVYPPTTCPDVAPSLSPSFSLIRFPFFFASLPQYLRSRPKHTMPLMCARRAARGKRTPQATVAAAKSADVLSAESTSAPFPISLLDDGQIYFGHSRTWPPNRHAALPVWQPLAMPSNDSATTSVECHTTHSGSYNRSARPRSQEPSPARKKGPSQF